MQIHQTYMKFKNRFNFYNKLILQDTTKENNTQKQVYKQERERESLLENTDAF